MLITKSAKFVLDLLKNSESNVDFNGSDIDALYISHIQDALYISHIQVSHAPKKSEPCPEEEAPDILCPWADQSQAL